MRARLLLWLALCLSGTWAWAGQASPENHPLDLSQEKFYVSTPPSSGQYAPSDTTNLVLLANRVNELADKSLRNYLISLGLSVGTLLLLLVAVGGNSAGLVLFAALVALASGVFGLISLVQMIIGKVKLKDLDDTLLAAGDKNLTLRFRDRVSRARTILNVLLVLTIISLIVNIISTVLGGV